MPLDVRTADGCVTFAVRVQPGAKRAGVVGLHGDAVKIALTAPAVDNKANDALTRYLAEVLGVPRLSIAIVAGDKSRSKIIRIAGITAVQVEAKLMAIEVA